MMEEKRSMSAFREALHEVFFRFAFVTNLHPVILILLWSYEKLALTSLILVQFLSTFPESEIRKLSTQILIFPMLDSNALAFVGDALGVIILSNVILFTLRLLYISSKNGFFISADYVLSYFLSFNFHFIPQLLCSINILLILMLFSSVNHSEYKGITASSWDSNIETHILQICICSFTTIFSLAFNFLYIFLYQEQKMFLHCSKCWETKGLSFISKLVLYAVFLFSINESILFLSSLIGMFLFGVQVIIRHSLPLGPNLLKDLGTHFFNSSMLFFEMILCLSFLSTEYEAQKTYQYSLIIPLMGMLASFIRYYRYSPISTKEVKSNEDSLDYVRKIINISLINQEYECRLSLLVFLYSHYQKCSNSSCKCEKLLKAIQKNNTYTFLLEENQIAYENKNLFPESKKKSWKKKVVQILLSDINLAQSSALLQIAIAEIEFYYLMNYYRALVHIQNVEQLGTSLNVSQGCKNLKNIINRGMMWSSKEHVKIAQALNFLNYYNLFISQLEDLSDSNIKFWSSIGENPPKLESVLFLAKSHYEQRYTILDTISNIIAISEKNLDFLLKYGLFIKVIVQDETKARQIFQRIMWIAEGDRVGRLHKSEQLNMYSNEEQVMVFIVSLEQKSMLNILKNNNEAEVKLGYNNSELFKYSISKIMPDIIARQHHLLVNRFFQTMKAFSLGIEKSRFIKYKNGNIKLCSILMNIIPGLSEGFRGALFMREDRLMRNYIAAAIDIIPNKSGAIMCDYSWKIIEVTGEIYSMFRLSEENAQSLKENVSLMNVFPELNNVEIRNIVSSVNGGVIKASFSRFSIEAEIEEEEMAILLWIRLVEEKYGDETANILFYSPIQKKSTIEYVPVPEYDGFIYEKKVKLDLLPKRKKKFALETVGKLEENKGEIDHFLEISDTNSVSSMLSAESTPEQQNMTQKAQDVINQIQEQSLARKTPSLIKKFTYLLAFSLLITLVLIGVETQQFYSTSVNLISKLELIESFQIRYAFICYVSAGSRTYDLYRQSPEGSVFESYCGRSASRVERLFNYHYNTLKGFEKIGTNYDAKLVTIYTDTINFSASLSYLLTTFLNNELVFLKIRDYDQARACLKNYVDSICIENNNALNFSLKNGMTIRNRQNAISRILFNDLLKLATSGKIMMYIIISICIGIVLITSIFIFVILIWVIKGKSKTISIFAEISDEDIKKVIEECKSVTISTARFKQSIIEKCEGDEQIFWNILKKKLRNFTRIEGSKKNVSEKKIETKEKIPENKEFFTPNDKKEMKNPKDFIEDPSEIQGNRVNLEELEQNRIQEQNLNRKREILNTIDVPLRNSSILKMMIITTAFLLYGCGSFYFNYEIYKFNDTATHFFYILAQRNVYGILLKDSMRGVVQFREKYKLYYSPDQDHELYMQDIIDKMYEIEKEITNYKQIGSRSHFPKFFEQTEIVESNMFCEIVDNYPVVQSGVCGTSYKGPKEQGLTAGMSYYIDYHVLYGKKIEATDFDNEEEISALTSDPGLSFPGAKLLIYLQSALLLQLITYRIEAEEYYNTISIIALLKGIGFVVIYTLIYIIILANLLNQLKKEIWLGHGLLQMVPSFILQNSPVVQQRILEIASRQQ